MSGIGRIAQRQADNILLFLVISAHVAVIGGFTRSVNLLSKNLTPMPPPNGAFHAV
jgi:hypothetical protein